MKTEPLVSIIIPTYNRAKWLVEAVESCLNQIYEPIEIIIIDDGSTDNTKDVVNEIIKYNTLSKHVVYQRQINSGASAARNKGLYLAKGDFIQFLDSDDFLFPKKIELQFKEIKENNADGCSCLGLMGETPEVATTILGEKFDTVKDLMHRMFSGRVHVMCTPAPLWKKSALLTTKGWNTEIAFGDDLEYHIHVLIGIEKMAFVPEKLFFVREHNDNRLSNAAGNIKQIESGIKTLQLITETIKGNGLWDKYFQYGIIKNARTLYASYMRLVNKSSICLFEQWFLEIAKSPVVMFKIFVLIYLRKYVGAKFILNVFKLKQKLLHHLLS